MATWMLHWGAIGRGLYPSTSSTLYSILTGFSLRGTSYADALDKWKLYIATDEV